MRADITVKVSNATPSQIKQLFEMVRVAMFMDKGEEESLDGVGVEIEVSSHDLETGEPIPDGKVD